MLAPIEFDRYPAIQTGKIEDKVAKGMLAAKFATVELAITQVLPESLFCIGWGIAERSLQFVIDNFPVRLALHGSCSENHPHPTLPLKGRA